MIKGHAGLSVGTSFPRGPAMSSQRRTFVLQAVGVAVVVGVIFFTLLLPSEPDELSGIDAPGSETPGFTLPGDTDGKKKGSGREAKDNASAENPRNPAGPDVVASASGLDGADSDVDGGPWVPPGSRDPGDDQYSSTATILMDRVKAADSGLGR